MPKTAIVYLIVGREFPVPERVNEDEWMNELLDRYDTDDPFDGIEDFLKNTQPEDVATTRFWGKFNGERGD